MAVEAGAGRDEINPPGTRGHEMKKKAGVESGPCGQEKLENNVLCRSSGPGKELLKRSEKERRYFFTPKLRLS